MKASAHLSPAETRADAVVPAYLNSDDYQRLARAAHSILEPRIVAFTLATSSHSGAGRLVADTKRNTGGAQARVDGGAEISLFVAV